MKFVTNTLKLAVVLATVVAAVACGGGGSSPVFPKAANDLTIGINPTTGPAVIGSVVNTPFVFPNGIPDFGTTSTTTVTFPTTGTFLVSNGTNTATGSLTFGSCRFTPTSSTIPGVPVGTTLTVANCSLGAATAGLALDGQTRDALGRLILNLVPSNSGRITSLSVSQNGDISINGQVVGKVTAVTGSS